jgi:hypothetical protein
VIDYYPDELVSHHCVAACVVHEARRRVIRVIHVMDIGRAHCRTERAYENIACLRDWIRDVAYLDLPVA